MNACAEFDKLLMFNTVLGIYSVRNNFFLLKSSLLCSYSTFYRYICSFHELICLNRSRVFRKDDSLNISLPTPRHALRVDWLNIVESLVAFTSNNVLYYEYYMFVKLQYSSPTQIRKR